MGNKIALYTLFNDDYFECGSNMIYSFINTNNWFVSSKNPIIIINDNKYCTLNDTNRQKLKLIYENIEFLDLDYLRYKRVFDNQVGIVPEKLFGTFYKLEIFKKNKYKRKLFLDADTLILQDIKELFDIDCYFAACLDYPLKHTGGAIRRTEDTYYFNTGVCCINDECKRKLTFNSIFNFCANTTVQEMENSNRKNNKGKSADQDYLNIFINNNDILLLSNMVYNYCCGFGINDVKKAKIIHYYGPFNKPWEKKGYNVTRNRLIYLLYYETDYWKNKLINN